jgi:hypothetical protein
MVIKVSFQIQRVIGKKFFELLEKLIGIVNKD